MWSFQPQLYNEVFDDDLDGQEGAGKGLTAKVSSPREEYMSLAAVPRFSRPSMELQVPTASATSGAALLFVWAVVCLAWAVVVSAPRDWETAMLLLSVNWS